MNSKKMNLLLEVDYKVACDRFNEGLIGLKHDYHKEAQEDFKEALRRAESAYRLSKKFKDKVRAKWLICYILILTRSYEYDSFSKTEKIKPLSKLLEKKQRYVAELIFNEIKGLREEFEKTKLTWKWVPGRKKQKEQMDHMVIIMLSFFQSRALENVNMSISSSKFSSEHFMKNIDLSNSYQRTLIREDSFIKSSYQRDLWTEHVLMPTIVKLKHKNYRMYNEIRFFQINSKIISEF